MLSPEILIAGDGSEMRMKLNGVVADDAVWVLG